MMIEGGLDCVTGLGKYKGRLIILLDVGKVLEFRKSANPEIATEPAATSTGKVTQSAAAGKK